MVTDKEKNTAFLTHLSSFFSFVFPFGSVLGPLVMWSVNKGKNEFVDQNGVEAVNFNLSFVLYSLVLGMMMFPFAFGSFFEYVRNIDNFDQINFHFSFNNAFGFLSIATVLSILSILKFVFIIVAAIKARQGEVYQYPLRIRFIREESEIVQ